MFGGAPAIFEEVESVDLILVESMNVLVQQMDGEYGREEASGAAADDFVVVVAD